MLRVDPATDMLAVIDVQPTFMPGGELPVPEGDQVVPVINHLLQRRFASAFATQDWHPPKHGSFATSHAGAVPYDTVRMAYGPQILWPDHAVQGTANAALHPRLDTDRLQMILRKGSNPAIDSYSAFLENDRATSTGLAAWLRERGVRRVFFCGLALDFCVAFSALDAIDHGFDAVIIEDACRGIGMPGPDGANSLDLTRRNLVQRGGMFLPASSIASG